LDSCGPFSKGLAGGGIRLSTTLPGQDGKKTGVNISISGKVIIFAACVTPHTIIKETFR
jgi:hypothetical protein